MLTATGASGKSPLASDEVESHAPESDEFVVAPVELFVAPGEFAVDQVLVAPIEFVVDPDVAALAESHETSRPPTVCVTLALSVPTKPVSEKLFAAKFAAAAPS